MLSVVIKMWVGAVCCLLFGLSFAWAQYEVNFASVDVDSILSNRRLMDAYTRCYLDRGPCAPPAREAKNLSTGCKSKLVCVKPGQYIPGVQEVSGIYSKEYMAEIFRTNCGKCTREQKKQIKSAFNKLIKQRPQDFLKIFAKYNPGNTHLGSFTRWLKTSD